MQQNKLYMTVFFLSRHLIRSSTKVCQKKSRRESFFFKFHILSQFCILLLNSALSLIKLKIKSFSTFCYNCDSYGCRIMASSYKHNQSNCSMLFYYFSFIETLILSKMSDFQRIYNLRKIFTTSFLDFDSMYSNRNVVVTKNICESYKLYIW